MTCAMHGLTLERPTYTTNTAHGSSVMQTSHCFDPFYPALDMEELFPRIRVPRAEIDHFADSSECSLSKLCVFPDKRDTTSENVSCLALESCLAAEGDIVQHRKNSLSRGP